MGKKNRAAPSPESAKKSFKKTARYMEGGGGSKYAEKQRRRERENNAGIESAPKLFRW